jgi:hypothetical protein
MNQTLFAIWECEVEIDVTAALKFCKKKSSKKIKLMARQKGIIKLKGKIGDLSFYKTQDGHLAREKGGVVAAGDSRKLNRLKMRFFIKNTDVVFMSIKLGYINDRMFNERGANNKRIHNAKYLTI